MSTPVDPPTLALDDADLVDWLELTALFDQYGTARLDALLGSLLEQEETTEDNIAERDRHREQLIERLENEVDQRQASLRDSYPFELSGSGDELRISSNWREHTLLFYIVCLITAHVTKSVILGRPPVEDLLTQLRNDIFQIVATLGLAGLAKGPAFSVGWPRRSGETIVELLARASAAGGGFTVRNPPGAYVAPSEKDGGVDVIAWTEEGTPPPSIFFWGQTASGKNWLGKPVSEYATLFSQNYMLDHMTGNHSHITVIPFRVLDQRLFNSESRFHRALLDRLRLPLRASQGLQLAAAGVSVDAASRIAEVGQWVDNYISYAMAP